MILREQRFVTSAELVSYVNTNAIAADRILAIVRETTGTGAWVLMYWE